MKKVTGAISLTGAVICLFALLYIAMEAISYYDPGAIVLSLVSFIVCISIIHYTLSTRFWTSK